MVRPGCHGRGACRLFDADLLVRPAPHRSLLEYAAVDARLRPYLVDVLLQTVTGFARRQSAVRSGRRLQVGLPVADPADHRSRHHPLAVIARQTRSAMLEVLGEDYVRTARSRPRASSGCRRACAAQRHDPCCHLDRPAGRRSAWRRHLTETIFSWPGIGKWMVDAVFGAITPWSRAVCC